jgi:23S rRNA (pseudouridine1915-N3)-methyltransferase
MKLRIITIGKPKLRYAQEGWTEYLGRLRHYHEVRLTQLADKYADDTDRIIETMGKSYKVGLIIEGKQMNSPQLATFLESRALEGREVCFIIGGPEGLPQAAQDVVDLQWSMSQLTFPHDLAMVILLETLYRASTINAGVPYHK